MHQNQCFQLQNQSFVNVCSVIIRIKEREHNNRMESSEDKELFQNMTKAVLHTLIFCGAREEQVKK